MKMWMKGAIIGGVWGLISGISILLMALSAMPELGSPHHLTTIDKLVFFPGWISENIFRLSSGVINWNFVPRGLQFLIYFGVPMIIGVLIGLPITKIAGLVRRYLI